MRSALLKPRAVVVPLLLLFIQACVAEDLAVEDGEITTDGGYELYVEPEPLVGELGAFKVHWSASRDHNEFDIVEFYHEGAPLNEIIDFCSVGGRDQSAGLIESWLRTDVLEDPRRIKVRVRSREDGRTVANSNAVTPVHSYDISISPDDPARKGRQVTVGWHAPRMHGLDTVALYQVGAPRNELLTYQQIWAPYERDGSMTFTLPDPSWRPGPYEFRLFVAGPQTIDVAGPVVEPE